MGSNPTFSGEMDTDKDKEKDLLIAYTWGQMTALGNTINTEEILKQIDDHTKVERLPLEVTESDVRSVMETLFRLRVLIKQKASLPYG